MAKNIFGKQSVEQIIMQMIQAIEDLHGLGFVHTDIKPEIFRIKKNRVFIIDLEHAREYIEKNHFKLQDQLGLEMYDPQFASIKVH